MRQARANLLLHIDTSHIFLDPGTRGQNLYHPDYSSAMTFRNFPFVLHSVPEDHTIALEINSSYVRVQAYSFAFTRYSLSAFH